MRDSKYLDSLFQILRIKSISTQDEFKPEMQRAREFLVKTFKSMGFSTQILKGKRHDLVFAERIVNPKSFTVLIYGHYDVQPPEPVEEWNSKPFEPVIRNGKIFARGATDNKGQFMANVMAVKEFLSKNPDKLNFKFLIEGEEEIGSISIEEVAKKYARTLLKCDLIIVSDSEMYEDDQPTIDVSLRGMTYAEIFLQSSKNDMHSGQFGNIAPNPAIELSRIIAKLKDSNGKVLIPDFYNQIVSFSKDELIDFNKLKISNKKLMEDGGMYYVDNFDKKYTLNERRWVLPTLDVNGITAGYQREGSKTIIPAKASAKISMRLVPNQDPEKIFGSFSKYIKSLVPNGMELKIINHSSALPYKAPVDNPVFGLAKKALKETYKKNAVFGGVGGSIGFVPTVANALNVPCVMIGFGLPDENLHAPNEHFSVKNYKSGIKSMSLFFELLSD